MGKAKDADDLQSGRGSDLRRRLIDAALEILSHPATPLDLRKVAEAADKSRTAPYLAFGKESEGGGLSALRMAVAAEGAEMLAERMEVARASTEDPRLAFHRVTRTFFAFATENERLFRLMFGPEIGTIPLPSGSEDSPHPEFENLVRARTSAERITAKVLADARAKRIVSETDPLRLTMGAWALMVGIAFLLLDRVLEAAGVHATVDEGAELATSILMGAGAESMTHAALALLAAREAKEGGTTSEMHDAVWDNEEDSSDVLADSGPELGAIPSDLRMRRQSTWSRLRQWSRRDDDEPPEEGATRLSQTSPSASAAAYEKATDTISTYGALRRAAMVGAALKGARVLWIDDHPKGLAWERRTLEALGVIVAPAWSTDVALERLREEPFDLIISDIARGDRADEGVAALPRLHAAAPGLPVIFYIHHLAAGRDVPKGAVGITNKVEELLHLVLDVLERRRL